MHHFKCRTRQALPVRLAVSFLLILLLTGAPANASATRADDEAAARGAVETFLRTYQEAAMLYEPRDLLSGTVAEPGLSPLPPDTVFLVSKEEKTLDQLRENIIFVEKKASFYAAMRQIQGIYRENLQLSYTFDSLEVKENTARASLTETAGFRYTDSAISSVYETIYSVWLVKLEGRWLIADVTDGSRFDKYYKEQGAAFDEGAALAEFAANLERTDCAVSFPYAPSDTGGRILYDGANAAAYAYTYSRQVPGTPRSDFYNPLFYSYAGQGGDCMNFGSQCMWAGFGGSQTSAAVSGRAAPMDVSGDSQWFGRAAGGSGINYSWISCQSFRQYLTGSKDGTGSGGSNAAQDAGMYATILDAGPAGALSGVTAEELVGAIAHVEGSGGSYSHTIVLTAAAGTKRSQVYFCGHTKDITHVKLGDYYIWDVKVYIPRYLRASQTGSLQAEMLQPVEAGGTGVLSVRAGTVQERITISVTAPGETAALAAVAEDADSCRTEYVFFTPGLYRVDCEAPSGSLTYYVRCYEPMEVPEKDPQEMPEETGELPSEEEIMTNEMPEWLRPDND